jgi:hypothetical protein
METRAHQRFGTIVAPAVRKALAEQHGTSTP